jgi:hypothetical protein
MFWRKILVGILAGMMASPVWAGAEPLGSVTSSKAATVRYTALSPGSTTFSGDAISVGTHGAARVALAGGAQAEACVAFSRTPDGGGRGSCSGRATAAFGALKAQKALVVILIGGGAAITACLLAREEIAEPTTDLQNGISPTKLNWPLLYSKVELRQEGFQI